MTDAICCDNLDNMKWIWKKMHNCWESTYGTHALEFMPLAARRGHLSSAKTCDWLSYTSF